MVLRDRLPNDEDIKFTYIPYNKKAIVGEYFDF